LRIRVVQKPSLPSIDAIALDRFVPCHTYEVGNALGAYLLAEGWAEPVALSIDGGVSEDGDPDYRDDRH